MSKQFNHSQSGNHITLSKVHLFEVRELQRISKQTFFETFAASNSNEDMEQYLRENFSSEKLAAELVEKESEFYFAKSGYDIIGYLKVNFGQAQTEVKDPKSLEIERIYVVKEYHGKKVGQVLFAKAIEVAKEHDFDYVWLGVWEKNDNAISFYRKNGFVEFAKHIFKLGDDEQTDLMMQLKLH